MPTLLQTADGSEAKERIMKVVYGLPVSGRQELVKKWSIQSVFFYDSYGRVGQAVNAAFIADL